MAQTTVDQELVTEKNRYCRHLFTHQKKYLFLLAMLVLSAPFVMNAIHDKPLFIGGESYYHLVSAEQKDNFNLVVFILSLIPLSIKQAGAFLLSPLLGLVSLYLFFSLAEKNKFSPQFTFFFLAFLIISPAFIFTFTTLSSYSMFIFLVVLGFLLLTQESRTPQYFSLLPFVAATFFDTFSTFLLLCLIVFYVQNIKNHQKKQDSFMKLLMGTVIFFIFINGFILHLPFIIGPFYIEQALHDLISDLGRGLSGISFFSVLLGFIGLIVALKKKRIYPAYLLLAIIIPFYIYRPEILFFLIILSTVFTTIGFIKIFEEKWRLPSLKKFTFLLLLLGIVFSTLAYLDRIPQSSPTVTETAALTWMKENIPKNEIVFSFPENSYYILYLSEHKPFYALNDQDNEAQKANDSIGISSALYIEDLFPLLEQHNISLIYITKDMKSRLPEKQGLLFLLKNEKFKLIYFNQEVEVWRFKKDDSYSS